MAVFFEANPSIRYIPDEKSGDAATPELCELTK